MTEPQCRTFDPKVLIAEVSTGDLHSWSNEFEFLWTQHRRAMLNLLDDVAERGIREPVVIGSDGRLWDGHHRVAVAIALHLNQIEAVDHRPPLTTTAKEPTRQ